MPQNFTIRPELPNDILVISDILREAFREDPLSQHNEQFIIESLRRSNVLAVSLVVEMSGNVVGTIAFSPVEISDGSQDWYGLGPVAVLPQYQRQGIGQALTQKGIENLRKLGAQGCAVLGEPDFYARFGFKNIPELILKDVPQEYFLALGFGEKFPVGEVMYHKAFQARS